jgi:hypothetical protein
MARSRALIPTASADGTLVDLYLATLQRPGYPNRLFINAGGHRGFEFIEHEDDFLTLSIDDHGRGTLADFDGDGNNDYLAVAGTRAMLFWHPASHKNPVELTNLAYSVKAADFNNDGNLDIFIGRFAPPTQSDRASFNRTQLHYVMYRNSGDNSDSISFSTASDVLAVNLNQHVQATEAERLRGANDIFLGRASSTPNARRFAVTKIEAAGKPASLEQPGVYIWYETDSNRWFVTWRYHTGLDVYKGVFSSEGFVDVDTTALTQDAPRVVSDYLLINDGKGNFSRLCQIDARHQAKTVAATIADFNNDGWLDIIGARHAEQGSPNGEIFVLENYQGQSFSLRALPVREQDKLQRADLVAHGFFDEDDRPDLVVTNGYGQIPGNNGVTQLLLNRSSADYAAVLIRLQGRTANTFGVGATLTLRDGKGSLLGYRVMGINSNISQDTFTQHFGLGDSHGPYTLTVKWPDGPTATHLFNSPGNYLIAQ